MEAILRNAKERQPRQPLDYSVPYREDPRLTPYAGIIGDIVNKRTIH